MTTLWQSLKFGMRAIALQRVAERPLEEILRLQRIGKAVDEFLDKIG